MNRLPIALAVVTAALLSGTAAYSSDFAVTPMKDGDTFLGCLAQNTQSGIGYLAVGDKLALFANTDKFTIAKGDQVKGSWAIDGGDATEFSSMADSDHTATIDVPNASETVVALTTGKELTVIANGVESTLPLAGTEQAFTDLMSCMQSQGAE